MTFFLPISLSVLGSPVQVRRQAQASPKTIYPKTYIYLNINQVYFHSFANNHCTKHNSILDVSLLTFNMIGGLSVMLEPKRNSCRFVVNMCFNLGRSKQIKSCLGLHFLIPFIGLNFWNYLRLIGPIKNIINLNKCVIWDLGQPLSLWDFILLLLFFFLVLSKNKFLWKRNIKHIDEISNPSLSWYPG